MRASELILIFQIPPFKNFFFILEREGAQAGGEGRRERESQAGPMLSKEPNMGLNPTTMDYDLS